MEKKSAILRIKRFDYKDGFLLLSAEDYSVRAMLKDLVDVCNLKYSGFVKVDLTAPHKSRTTGPQSQNNLIWKLITEISKETGNDLHDVEEAAKERAIRRGYPYHQNKITGQIKPVSMTEISTVEAGYLIDELYQIAAEYGVNVEY